MTDSETDRPAQCPRLQPTRPYRGTGWIIGVYCRRPDGTVRVPRRDEQRAYCLSGRWPECPGNRTHAAAP